ncbi:HK97 gp10 family phage protein [Deinococcus saxicola]
MAYRKLSELVNDLENPQQSDTFAKLFKAAVRDGRVVATDLPERFTLPKAYTRRGAEGTYQRNTREMVYEVTPKAEKWAEDTRAALAQARTRTAKVQLTSEAAESGAVDFKALAAETRRKMQARHEKGQKLGLGNSRKKK